MRYIKESSKSVQEVVDTICEKAASFKFGVLHIHNVAETLKSKGFDFENECQILDVCNPKIANELLTTNMNLSCVMPCKISVYSENKQTKIILNSFEKLVEPIEKELITLAKNTQETLIKLIDEAS